MHQTRRYGSAIAALVLTVAWSFIALCQTIPNHPGSQGPGGGQAAPSKPSDPCNPCAPIPPSQHGFDYSQETDPYLKYAENVKLKVPQVAIDKFPTVQAFVTVTDQNGILVRTLKEGDFTATENGQAVKDLRFGNRDELNMPLAVMFVVDISGSMQEAMESEIAAINTFVQQLKPEDRVGLIYFSDAAVTAVKLTTDHQNMLSEASELTPWGQTALWDAVYLGINELVADSTPSRKALIVLSDGGDNRSLENPQTILRLYQDDALANNKGFSIFSLGLGEEIDRSALQSISDKTGGGYFDSPTPEDLQSVYEGILTQLQNEYILEYESPTESQPGQIIDIEVGLTHVVQSFAPGTYTYRSPGLSEALARAMWPGLIAICILMLLLILATIYKLSRRVWLTVMITPLEGKDYPLGEFGAHIGSAERCEVRISRDAALLPIHASIQETAQGYLIEALNSEAPLASGGLFLQKKLLRHGDKFVLGTTQFVFNERTVRSGSIEVSPAMGDAVVSSGPGESTAQAPVALTPVASALPAVLVALDGPHTGSSFSLSNGENVVGRMEGNILLGADSQVSRKHCTIVLAHDHAKLTDLGSTNGTRLNGQACQPAMAQIVKIGDTLGIGSGHYRLE